MNIIGTEGQDTLVGDNSDNLIISLGGDDIILANGGDDSIFAGSGDDTILGGSGDDSIFGGSGDDLIRGDVSFATDFPTFDTNNDTLFGGIGNDTIYGDGGNDLIFGFLPSSIDNSVLDNDEIFGGSGNDTIFGSGGNDTIDGGIGNDTANYSLLEDEIILEAQGFVDKGITGVDQLIDIETIIAPDDEKNLIDATSSTSSPVSIEVSLLEETLAVLNIPGVDDSKFSVINFVDVIGTSNNDIIHGSNDANILTGGAGNDQIFAISNGNSTNENDIIIGVNPNDSNPGSDDEVDTLVGSSGPDTFVLGDSNNVFYLGDSSFGFSERAVIEQFQSGQDTIQLKGSLGDYSFFGTNIFFSDNEFDLIAQVPEGFSNSDLVFV